MSIKNTVGLVIMLTAAMMAGCASTPTGGSGPGGVATTTPAVTEVPALKVAVDCGPCDVKPTVAGLIVQGYNEAAAKAGHRISDSRQASLVIKEYTARSDTARFLAGAFAGKDEIKAVVSYQGKSRAVEDYYRNAWLGIDALAKKIGEMTYAEIR